MLLQYIMKLNHSIRWMLIGSIIIGIYFNGMNILAYRFDDLYFSSKTLIYSALFMASNMCILEVLMFYNHTEILNIKVLLTFSILSIMLVWMLRTQFLVDDSDWLKRMISHHSTALRTSHKILNRTNNSQIKELANDIIETQEREIKLMKSLL